MNARTITLLMALSLGTALLPAEAQTPVAEAPLPGTHSYAMYTKRAELKVSSGKSDLVSLKIAGEVLAECSPDLSDLRLVAADGHEIPYAVEPPPRGNTDTSQSEVLAPAQVIATAQRGRATEEGSGLIETYELSPPPTAMAHAPLALQLEITRGHFVRQVAFGVKGASAAARSHASIFRISNGTAENTRIVLPKTVAASGKALMLEFTGAELEPLEPVFSWVAASAPSSDQRFEVPLIAATQSTDGNLSTVTLPRAPGIVPSTLRFATSTARFQRHVSVFDGPGPENGTRLAAGLLLRTGAVGEEVLDIEVAASRGRSIRLEIDNQDSPPLADLAVSARVAAPTIVFAVPSNTEGLTLRFGGGRARRPRYDVTGLVRVPGVLARVAEVLNVRLSEMTPHARTSAWPAVPAALVDARRYSHTKPLVVSSDVAGADPVLVRIPLGVNELSVLRTDRGDMRIVDSKHQSWPYVLTPSEDLTSLEVAALGPHGDETERPRFDITMPASPTMAAFLLLQSRDLLLNRPYTLRGLGPNGVEQFSLHGTLIRDLEPSEGDELPKFVARIAVPAVAIVALQLEVQNGDNRPPVFERAHVLARTAELVSPLPPGTYELLLGRTDDAPPIYDLESSRALLLSEERHEVVFPSQLTSNPSFLPSLAKSAPGVVPAWLLWSSLVAAVLVLGVVTLRHSALGGDGDTPPAP